MIEDVRLELASADRPHWIRARDIAITLSLSNLAFLPVWSQLIGDSLDERTSYGMASAGGFLAAVINILAFAAVFYLSTTVLRRINKSGALTVAQILFWLFFLFSAASVMQTFVAVKDDLQSTFGGLSGFSRIVLSSCAAGMCVSARVRSRKGAAGALLATPFVLIGNVAPLTIVQMLAVFGLLGLVMWHRKVGRAASIITLALFPFVPMTLFHAGWAITQFREKAGANLIDSTRSGPRIVWIIFDGLDYKMAFEQRPAHLELPELDRLKSDSTFATNAYPPADFTLMSMPALISGKLVSATEPKDPSTLMVTYSDSDEPVSWGTQPSVFSQARELGVNGGIVGWYHPYCRIIGDQLVSCMSCNTGWSSLSITGASQLLAAVRENPLVPRIGLLNTSDADARRWREELIQSYREILQASLDAVSNPKIGLLLLHLPVPHPPAIFNRATGDFDASGNMSYLDSLALVDKTLGEIRRTMDDAGLWEDAVIILSADHWWRGDLWRNMRDSKARSWTAEDESVFTGLDERIPFIVKAAGQHGGQNYASEFNTVLTRDLILALLSGKVTNAASVVDWLDTHRSVGKRPYKYQRPR